MISGYDSEAPPVQNLVEIINKELQICGFVVTSLRPKCVQAFYSEIPARIASGELKYTEEVTEGLENSGEAILDIQSGKNKGKSVVRVARDEMVQDLCSK